MSEWAREHLPIYDVYGGTGMNADTAAWMGRSDDIARFFEGDTAGRELFDRVASMIDALGPTELRAGRSHVALRRGDTFALVWRPSMYLDDEVERWLARAWEAAGKARGARSAGEQPGRR